MKKNSPVQVARALIFCLLCLLGILIAREFKGGSAQGSWIGGIIGAGFAGLIIFIDHLIRNYSLKNFSRGTFGLAVGFLSAFLILKVDPFQIPWLEKRLGQHLEIARSIYTLCAYCALGFWGMTIALRSNLQEFSFVIPYVKFSREVIDDSPLIVDTNVIIDGRIPAVHATGFLNGSLVIPRFVLDELHLLADSKDPIKNERGKKGLENLDLLKDVPGIEITFHESEMDEQEVSVDKKLVSLSRILTARLITNDANLIRVARIQGVRVLSFNELIKAMHPRVTMGDEMEIAIVKEGKDNHQGVGYLQDGTMVVVNQAAEKIGTTIPVMISSALQTSAGRMFFAEIKTEKHPPREQEL